MPEKSPIPARIIRTTLQVPSSVPDGGRACFWDGYEPSIIQEFQEGDVVVHVRRGKLHIGPPPFESVTFCYVGTKHGFLEFGV